MTAYYNENDPKAAAWLRALIDNNLIAPGDVDERSIEDVRPDELAGYTQHHFFAGIGGWSYALRLAGWPDDRPVWTGSCPCQPFSAAGKGKGTADDRHLWPAFYWLIAQCQPAIVFGEQVASKAGRAWLAGVQADLEALGYAVAGADLCAAGINAPHIRQRLWWVGNSRRARLPQRPQSEGRKPMGFTREAVDSPSALGYWNKSVWASCSDGKTRRIEPGIEPLVDGIPGRVAQLRGLGNAIVPQLAAEFIQACEESR